MRIRYVAAALVCLCCAVLTASCLQSPSAPPETDPGGAQSSNGPESIGEAPQESASGPPYVSDDFPFVVFLDDDGKDEGGGWQRALKTFKYMERNWFIPNYFWQCPLRIEVPLRTKLEGPISASRAALMSAEIANEVVDPLLYSRPTWRNQGAVFCGELRDAMQAMFKRRYPNVGARVRRP
jgi:hypothetical protein